MEINRCISCEKEVESYPCSHCGFDRAAYQQPEYALPCDTVLHGRYLIGKVLGQGGFGITYVGWDLALEIKVAIKEYYPNGQVTRSVSGRALNWYTNAQSETLRQNGSVTKSGWKDVGWKNIIFIDGGISHVIGLRNDGTVLALKAGDHSDYNQFGECNISDWKNIKAIAAGFFHSVGVHSDGSVVATGKNDDGQCNVENWNDITAVAAGKNFTVGLKKDGTVVTTAE